MLIPIAAITVLVAQSNAQAARDEGPAFAESELRVDSIPATESPKPGRKFVMPVLFYSPETGVGGGLAGGYWRMPVQGGARHSEVGAEVVYTAQRQFAAGVSIDLDRSGGRQRLQGRIGAEEFPTQFWGIGNETPDSAMERYTPRAFGVEWAMQKRVHPGLYLGPASSVGRVQIRSRSEEGRLEDPDLPGSNGGWSLAAGFRAAYDSRDHTADPRTGAYVLLSALHHVGEHKFAELRLDLRGYRTIGHGVMAVQGLGVGVGEQAPFYALPAIGGTNLLRGYAQGRFRDRHLLAAQAEYRLPILGRFGATVFASIGQVGSEAEDFRIRGFKTAGGMGLRYRLFREERLSIRLDFGFADHSDGMYVAAGEAF